MLVVLSITAIALAIWCQRPSPDIAIHIDLDGSPSINGETSSLAAMEETLVSESNYRKRWHTECRITIHAPPSLKMAVVTKVVDIVNRIGADEILISVVEQTKNDQR